jgi:hypothetical protein
MLQLHAIFRRSQLTLAACVPLVLTACGGGGGGSDESRDIDEVSGGAPQVTIVSPADNSRFELPSAIDVRANASDAGGSVVEVEFFANGQSIGRDTEAPYTARWMSPAKGSHVLTAVARDDDGNATTSAGVDVVIEGAGNLRPTVTLASPPNGARLKAPVRITMTADAVDADGEIVQVDFYVGSYPIARVTEPPFIYEWDAPPGVHTLTVVATDDAGDIDSSPQVTIEVENADGIVPQNVPPTIVFRTPAENAELVTPVDIGLEAIAEDVDGSIVAVDFYVDGTLIGSATSAPWTVRWTGAAAGEHVLSAIALDDGADTGSTAVVVTVVDPVPGEFVLNDVRMGDPDLCYVNPEFSDDGEYVVWGERIKRLNDDGEGIVRMWHCAIDQETGEFIPWDCKGFAGFDSTNWGRAYMGRDSQGLFYLGANENYQLTMTRITGPDSGVTTVLGSLVDRERRAIYPSVLPDSDKIYAYWLKSHGENVTPQGAEWVELRYVDIDDPTNEVIVERQYNTRGLVAMDVTFPRWAFHEPLIHFGREDEEGRINIWQLDASKPGTPPVQLTNDWHIKTGPYPVEFEGRRYILSGVDGETDSYVYREPEGGGIYEVIDTFAPAAHETFPNACLANSHEPFIRNGKLFTSWQITDCTDTDDVFAFLSEPGEIWFTQLLDDSDELWQLNQSSTDVKNEPEPVVGTSEAWVFYTAYPDGYDQGSACYEVRRAATPASFLD